MGRITFAFVSLLSAHTAMAASEIRLQPVKPTPESVASIGGAGTWGLIFDVQSLMPTQSPFQTVGQNFYRFDASTGFGVEINLGLTSSWEVGLTSGYEGLQSRSQDGNGAATQFQTASLTQIPLEAIMRYRWNKRGWAPEVEVGAGWGFGSLSVTSTNTSFTAVTQSETFLRGHAAVGLGFPWTDDFSVHTKLGYAFEALPGTIFPGNVNQVEQISMSGAYFKGELRYTF